MAQRFCVPKVVIDPELISGLQDAGNTGVWQKLFLPGDNKPCILRVKNDDGGELDPQRVYDVLVTFKPKEQGRTTLSYWEVKFYLKPEGEEAEGRLRLFCCSRSAENEIHLGGKPLAEIRFDGVSERCKLIVEPIDEIFEPTVEERYREVLVQVPAIVQIYGPEEVIPGAVRIEIDQGEEEPPMVVYDHRQDRLTASFGLVEHVRSTAGERENTFFNVNDLPGDVDSDEVEYIFTNSGLQTLEESIAVEESTKK